MKQRLKGRIFTYWAMLLPRGNLGQLLSPAGRAIFLLSLNWRARGKPLVSTIWPITSTTSMAMMCYVGQCPWNRMLLLWMSTPWHPLCSWFRNNVSKFVDTRKWTFFKLMLCSMWPNAIVLDTLLWGIKLSYFPITMYTFFMPTLIKLCQLLMCQKWETSNFQDTLNWSVNVTMDL